ncbi:hypothetical protein EMN47_18645 [Prolixibacteraceae bacterium JC049]|nr:hypothetical protein [Prolixibacteraceae bacterium JC049]
MFDFSGKYYVSVDDKGRVVIPAPIKKEMGDDAMGMVTLEKDPYENCLNVYPKSVWQRRIERIRSKLDYNNRNHSRVLDSFYQRIAKVALSDKGRVNVPAHLISEAHLQKEVVITGQGERFRIWDKALYEQSVLSADDYAQLFEQCLGGSIDPEE